MDGLVRRIIGLHPDRYGSGNPVHYGPHNSDDNPNSDNDQDQDQNDDEDNSAPPLPHIPPFGNYYDPPISPLVLDLDGDGIELVALSDSRTLFDLDSDGFAQHTGWVKSDDALLALDRNGNGRIDDISELFGNGTVDGFTKLATLDSNGDGKIDAADDRFGDLRLWRDLSGNGQSEADELQSLADGGVKSISLGATVSDTTLAGHRISHTSTFTRADGTTGTIVDAWFENDRLISAYVADDGFTLHEDVGVLPELRGYGVVPPLSVAMTLDAGLRQGVRSLVESADTASLSDFRSRVEAIVLDWTGADVTDPDSRGPGMDARYLAAMEALMGTRFHHHNDEYEANPGPIAALTLESDFQNYIDMVTVRLLVQSAVSSFLIDVSESPDTADLSDVYNHPLSWLGTLPFNRLTNELSGDLDDLLQFYVRSHAEGSTPPLDIEDTVALLRMLRLDFGQDEASYRTAVQAAFVAAGFTATVAGDYANRAIEPHMRYVNGTDGADRLQSTERSEVLVGGTGDDTYVWGSGHGNDVTDEEGGPDDNDTLILEGLNPEDILVRKFSAPGYRSDLMIVIQATGEWLILDDQGGDSEDDIERIVFADGTVWDKEALAEHARLTHVIGTKDGDNLTGTDGDDWLEGQGGNDTLSGGAGADWYVFEEGDGADVVDDGGTDRDTDKLIIRGYNSSDATLSRSGNDAVITFANGDKVTLTDQMAQSRAFIERIVFADGTEWTAAELRTHVFDGMKSTGAVAGTPMADRYTHALGDGSYSITEQDDRWGRHPDRLTFSDVNPGQVSLSRDGGSAVITLSNGDRVTLVNQMAQSYAFIERIVFADGTEWTAAELRTHVFDGMKSTGAVAGTPMADTYTHALGDGSYSITEQDDRWGRHPDRLTFSDVNPGQVSFSRDGGSAVITLSNGERVTLVNQMAQSYAFIERIVFADGTEWTAAELRTHVFDGMKSTGAVAGTPMADRYTHALGDGSYSITEQDDRWGRHPDRLTFTDVNPGQVSLSRDGGSAVITLSNGDRVTLVNQMAQSYAFIERIVFADGTEWTAAELRTHVFDGMKSTGAVAGTPMADTYTHALGDGSYAITEQDDRWGRHPDRLTFSDANPGQVSFSRDGGSAVITLSNGERVTLVNQMAQSYAFIERIVFADGTEWTAAELRTHVFDGMKSTGAVAGTPMADTYTHALGDGSYSITEQDDRWGRHPDRLTFTDVNPGQVSFSRDGGSAVITLSNGERVTLVNQMAQSYAFIERIVFADGTEWTAAELRTHVFDGMKSTGAVAGTPMADRYTHALGDGSYSITEQDDRWGRHPDRLTFSDVNPGQVSLSRDGDSAVITLSNGERVTLVNQMAQSYAFIERIVFADGTEWTAAELRTHVFDGMKSTGAVAGTPMADTYTHALGDGSYSITEQDDRWGRHPDRLTFTDVNPGQVSLSRDGGSAVITLSNGDRVTLVNQMAQSYAFIERIVFADGTEWALQDLRARLLLDLASDGHDVIHGFDGDDSIVGGLGDDTLYGGDGNDTVKGMAGNDVLHGGDGDDDLFGGDDDDILHGSLGADSFDGGTGNDTIDFSYSTYDADFDLATAQVVFSTGHTERLVSIENVVGTRGDNAITGSDTANTLNGGNGNDTLTGGAGNDILFGAAGADTFVFNTDDGADTIEDFEDGVDTIRFGISGLTFADLTIADDGDDALITYDGGDTIRLTDTSSEDLTASDFAFA